MTKTSIDIDDELLAKAAKALGTSTKRDTVNQALAQTVRLAAFDAEVEFAKNGGYGDPHNPEVTKGTWR